MSARTITRVLRVRSTRCSGKLSRGRRGAGSVGRYNQNVISVRVSWKIAPRHNDECYRARAQSLSCRCSSGESTLATAINRINRRPKMKKTLLLLTSVLILTVSCQPPPTPTAPPTPLPPTATDTLTPASMRTAALTPSSMRTATPTVKPVGDVVIPGLPKAPIPGRTKGDVNAKIAFVGFFDFQ